MPEFTGRLRPPRLPAAPSSPAVGEMYYDTVANLLYFWNGTAWTAASAGSYSPPTLVTSLPGSPVDGQEVYYQVDATAGINWHLRYRSASASAYKWEFLGGPPLQAQVTGDGTPSSFNAFIDLSTVGPSLTVPRAGDYEIVWTCYAGSTETSARWMLCGPSISGTTPGIYFGGTPANTPSGEGIANCGGAMIAQAVAASAVVKLMYYVAAATTGKRFNTRYLLVRPLRVG